jgi:putative Holliday junction resolvase
VGPAGEVGSIMALDIGSARIGVAIASGMARIPHPIGALPNDAMLIDQLRNLCRQENVAKLVIGLPRNLSGQETAQTATARGLGLKLAEQLDLPFHWQDEAVTSVQAEAELKGRGRPYDKGDVDALAAVYILEDYLHVGI